MFSILIYFKMQFIPVMQSWISSIITLVSYDPAEIILICWFGAQKHVLLLSELKTIVQINI